METHGIEVSRFNERPDLTADFAVVWSWRVGDRLRTQNGFTKPILVMERGYLGDRFHWTSLGWDGLNGRARFNQAHDSGERFWKHFGHLAFEWERCDGYALLIGQVIGDMALQNVQFPLWAMETAAALTDMGLDVRFRPHPEAIRRGQADFLPGVTKSVGTLDDALSGASFVVCWNSNVSVDAALAGVPVIAIDQGSMAWDVAGHALGEMVTPDRSQWFRDLAWKQWTPEEIQSGLAWEIVREAM